MRRCHGDDVAYGERDLCPYVRTNQDADYPYCVGIYDVPDTSYQYRRYEYTARPMSNEPAKKNKTYPMMDTSIGPWVLKNRKSEGIKLWWYTILIRPMFMTNDATMTKGSKWGPRLWPTDTMICTRQSPKTKAHEKFRPHSRTGTGTVPIDGVPGTSRPIMQDSTSLRGVLGIRHS